MVKGKYKNYSCLCSSMAAWYSVNRSVTVSQNDSNLIALGFPFN